MHTYFFIWLYDSEKRKKKKRGKKSRSKLQKGSTFLYAVSFFTFPTNEIKARLMCILS